MQSFSINNLKAKRETLQRYSLQGSGDVGKCFVYEI